jgi:hypothetical protein
MQVRLYHWPRPMSSAAGCHTLSDMGADYRNPITCRLGLPLIHARGVFSSTCSQLSAMYTVHARIKGAINVVVWWSGGVIRT